MNPTFDMRVEVATRMLEAMITSAPVCDRTKINGETWCKIAVGWADKLIATVDSTRYVGPGE